MKMTLRSLMDAYLEERTGLGRMTLARAARYRMLLIGDSSLPMGHTGFVRFLECGGTERPSLDELTARQIGDYWEFLAQHHGTLHAAHAMKALRAFWKWCVENEYREGRTPPDLLIEKPAHLYGIRTVVSRPGQRA